jgi:hypothetical protein
MLPSLYQQVLLDTDSCFHAVRVSHTTNPRVSLCSCAGRVYTDSDYQEKKQNKSVQSPYNLHLLLRWVGMCCRLVRARPTRMLG